MPPPTKKSLLRDYQPSLFLNRALLELYFLGGVVLGGIRDTLMVALETVILRNFHNGAKMCRL